MKEDLSHTPSIEAYMQGALEEALHEDTSRTPKYEQSPQRRVA